MRQRTGVRSRRACVSLVAARCGEAGEASEADEAGEAGTSRAGASAATSPIAPTEAGVAPSSTALAADGVGEGAVVDGAVVGAARSSATIVVMAGSTGASRSDRTSASCTRAASSAAARSPAATNDRISRRVPRASNGLSLVRLRDRSTASANLPSCKAVVASRSRAERAVSLSTPRVSSTQRSNSGEPVR
ncbi:MAG: hypothetical protein U0132_09755 [Gemmatimonadaceae bacterium]